MNRFYKLMQGVAFVGQLGFSLVTPPLVLVYLAWLLQRRFDLGAWIMVLAILVGLLSSGASAYTTFRRLLAKQAARDRKHKGGDAPK